MEDSLNSFLTPFDAAGAIGGLDASPFSKPSGASLKFDQGKMLYHPSQVGGLSQEDQLKQDFRVEWVRKDAMAGRGNIDLNFDQRVAPSMSLNDLVEKRQGILGQSDLRFRQMQDQVLGPEKVMRDLPQNGMGKLALVKRLEEQFGFDWRSKPEAVNLLNSFESNLAQGQDIESLNSMIEQGKSVLDFIKEGSGREFEQIFKLGGKEIGRGQLFGGQSWHSNYGISEQEWNAFMNGGNL